MKQIFSVVTLLMTLNSWAESPCDIRPGTSIGIKVVEFATGHTIHSKMPFSEATPDSILEEMVNLQDEGICTEKIMSQRCILKLEKSAKTNMITLIRGQDRWSSWKLDAKSNAEKFVKNLKRVGFCS